MPALTVLMPVLNAQNYIQKAVESSLMALPKDSNICVLDDGSTDQTLEVLDRISDSRLKVFQNSKSKGVANALNRLINLTDSKYVARMDADDICEQDRFIVQIEAIANVDIHFSRLSYINSDSKLIGRERSTGLNFRQASYCLPFGNVFSHPTMMAHRTVLETLGGYFDTNAEDFDLWLRAVTAGFRLEKSGRALVRYRLHPDQVSSKSDWKQKMVDNQLLSSYEHYMKKIYKINLESISNSSSKDLHNFLSQNDVKKIFTRSISKGPFVFASNLRNYYKNLTR